MVYGIIELINFAHGDLFMLGSFLRPQRRHLARACTAAGHAVDRRRRPGRRSCMLVAAPVFCAALNVAVDRAVYKPLRNAPKLSRRSSPPSASASSS